MLSNSHLCQGRLFVHRLLREDRQLNRGPDDGIVAAWFTAFFEAVQAPPLAGALRDAATSASLAEWTRLLTGVVVASCEALGWPAAGKGHRLELLPQRGQEYLGIDVMAFPADTGRGPAWPFPLAVFELENRHERAAYSLWKVICVRAELRVVFAYRNDREQGRELVQSLKREVIEGYSVEQRLTLDDRTLLITGSRGEGETFPYDYFKVWRLNPSIGSFELFTDWG